MKNNITILGASFDTDNRGVSALANSVINIFLEVLESPTITFLVSSKNKSSSNFYHKGRNHSVDFLNFRMSPKSKLNEHILYIFFLAILWRIFPVNFSRRAIASSNPIIFCILNSDLIGDIRGGDSFSDIYGLRRLILNTIPFLVVKLLKGEYVLLPQTFGPYKSRFSRFLSKITFFYSSYIFARDLESATYAKKLLYKYNRNTPVSHCPDVAFCLEAKSPDLLYIKRKIALPTDGYLIGFNVSGLLYYGGYSRTNMFNLAFVYSDFIEAFIKKLLRHEEIKILLIPHTFAPYGSVNSDPQACHDLYDKLGNDHLDQLYLLLSEYNESEIKKIIGYCDFFIGSRMHSCIAALSQNIPTIAISYSKKFKGVFESVGAGDYVIDAENVALSEAISRSFEIFTQHRNGTKEFFFNNDDVIKSIHSSFIELNNYISKKPIT